jgi:hypothetical protein
MGIPTIAEIVSRYLYDQPTVPVELANERWIRPAGVSGQAVEISTNEFMTTGGGRYVGVERFRFVRSFLGVTIHLKGSFLFKCFAQSI